MKIQSQLTLALIPVLLLTGGATILLTRKTIGNVIVDEVSHRGLSRLADIESRAADGFASRSESDLLPLLTSLVTQDHALYAIAMDPEGKVLAHTNVVEVGSVLKDAVSLQALASDAPGQQLTVWRGTPVIDLSLPVRGRVLALSTASEQFMFSGAHEGAGLKRLGTLRLGLPLHDALDTERKISRQIAVLVLMMAISILGVGILVIRSILKPANDLVDAADKIARGVYGAQVPVPSATEFARLANAFNQMSGALEQTTVSKDFLDSILANMLDPLLVIQPDQTIRMVNSATLNLLGYEAAELTARPLRDLIENAPLLLGRVISERQLMNVEVILKTKKGVSLTTLFSGSAWRDAEQNLRGIIVIMKDLTERKKFENSALQSEKLSAVGKLASGVAHEINNPLGVILGFSEELLSELTPENPWIFPMKSIVREAIRCRDLVQDLLTFSRVSKTEREPVDLNEAVRGALSLVSAQARLGQVEIVERLTPGLPRILANVNQVQQIVINLANNALDAMEQKGTLTLCTSVEKRGDQPWVVLSVTDSGSGIPDAVLGRIFEPFFTTKPVGQGTGLGLGLVHELVEKNGGTITVESRPGNTVFCVCFGALDGPTSGEQ